MRIAIIGNSGSGKSTLAREFAVTHDLTMLDLDSIAWVPGKIAVARDHTDAVADLRAFCAANDRWVLEGCYASLIQASLEYRPILLFMEPGDDACLANCRSRPWESHKYQSKREQDEKLEFLLSWVKDYYSRSGDLSLGAHQALFDAYPGAKHKLTHRVGRDFIDQTLFR